MSNKLSCISGRKGNMAAVRLTSESRTLLVSIVGLLMLGLVGRVFGSPQKAITNPDPTQRGLVLWYTHPADKWENALPVGNGRLGAMVFGRTDEEQIQLNEDTYWTGGPYSTVVKGSYKALPEIQ